MTSTLQMFTDAENKVEVRRQDALALLRSLDDASVDLVLTDPPYGISYQSNHRKSGKSAPIAADYEFEPAVFMEEIERVLAPDSAAYLFTRWDVYPDWFRAVPDTLAVKNFIVWLKDNHSAGDLKGNFGFKYEGIMMLVKGRHSLRGLRHSNVWSFPRIPFTQQRHPAEKPVALLQRAIEASTDPDGLVLDPFCGSGSTAEAALLSGRRALVGDVEKRWLRETLDRLGLPPREEFADPEPRGPGNRDTLIDLSILDGIHPEDVLAMLQDWKSAP
jgi:site-specific DNA-methyltransferase (adenine-specific)